MTDAPTEHGNRWKDLDIEAMQAYADTHTRVQTAGKFHTSIRTLKRRGIQFKWKLPEPKGLRRAAEILASGGSQREAAAQAKIAAETLRNRGLTSVHPQGQPKANPRRVALFGWLVTKKGMTHRKAEGIAGITRQTWQKYRRLEPVAKLG